MHAKRMLMRVCTTLALLALIPSPVSLDSTLQAQKPAPACSLCTVWNVPQAPFRIYGNTYYVGPHGLASILIVSDAGLVLIDGALPQSAPQIAANIHSLGFRIEDVKLILNSHAHFDHAGGIAELQRLSGAEVVVSPWSAEVMKKGGVDKGDPRYGDILGIPPVAGVRTLHAGESLHLGQVVLTPHATPGHTPGGTSWTWQSCDAGRCLDMVYADSISAVSAEGYKFSQNPHAMQEFEQSFAFLDHVPCGILLTPHGESSGFWDHIDQRNRGVKPDPLIDSSACRKLADAGREQLKKRIATETAH